MHRFDIVSRLMSSRSTRRSTVIGASAILATVTGLGAVQGMSPGATPAVSLVPDDTEMVSLLVVWSSSSATFVENTDANNTAEYLLTMKGHTGGPVFFSDRPDRIFGEAPTQKFLDGLGFDPANPPSAAIVTTNTDGTGDVLVMELINASTGELNYGASVLQSYTGDGSASCSTSNDCFGNICYGLWWSWSELGCEQCSASDTLNDQCNSTFSGCNGECVAQTNDTCHVGDWNLSQCPKRSADLARRAGVSPSPPTDNGLRNLIPLLGATEDSASCSSRRSTSH